MPLSQLPSQRAVTRLYLKGLYCLGWSYTENQEPRINQGCFADIFFHRSASWNWWSGLASTVSLPGASAHTAAASSTHWWQQAFFSCGHGDQCLPPRTCCFLFSLGVPSSMAVFGGHESLDSWPTYMTQDALVISQSLTDPEDQLITSKSCLHEYYVFKLWKSLEIQFPCSPFHEFNILRKGLASWVWFELGNFTGRKRILNTHLPPHPTHLASVQIWPLYFTGSCQHPTSSH